MELRKRVGKRIQQLRVERNLRQSELAELVGSQTKTQSCIETGRNFPKANLLEKYAIVFGIDVADVINIKGIDIPEDDYFQTLNQLLQKASKKQIEYIYKHAKLVMEIKY